MGSETRLTSPFGDCNKSYHGMAAEIRGRHGCDRVMGVSDGSALLRRALRCMCARLSAYPAALG
jgi:hypothetical protein